MYNELNQRANQLAHYLRSQGVGPDVLVGICVERSLEMIVGILGILKAGGAYLPLDPIYPPDRLAYIIEDAKPAALLTQSHLQDLLPVSAFCLDNQWGTLESYPRSNPPNITLPDHLAYVIYTSGSTGKPKGSLLQHANVTRLFSATDEWFHFDQNDTWTLFHSYAFDFSVWEIWGALLYGGKLVIVPYLVSRSPEQFHQLLVRERVTILNQTPSAFQQLVEVDNRQTDALALSLRKVIFGGEALNQASLAPWFERHGYDKPQLINMYGITETTVHVTYHPLEPNPRHVSCIGRPIPDLGTYLLDANLNPVPVGVPGELYISGDGLARGYINRPDLTAERFIPNPFPPPSPPHFPRNSAENGGGTGGAVLRLYKTGDLACYLPDGDIAYLGRIDHQVKIRGFRIELGEIETALAALPEVREVVVVAREDQPGDKRLVAYLTTDAEIPEPAALRSKLAQSLPEYMLPSAFVPLERFPLTPNGKIDRKALPAPDTTRSEVGYLAPRNPAEEQLAHIWAEVLKRDKVGAHDNFFELGGHSLLATQVVSRIRQAFDAELPLRTLFQTPTIADLAEQIQTLQHEKVLPLRPVPRDEPLPLSFAQQRLWFLDQFEPNSAFYNIPSAVRLIGDLDEAALRRALNEIVRRHESLRTHFVAADGEPLQVIADQLDLPIPLTDLSHLPAPEREARARQLTQKDAQTPFNLATGPLIRAALLRLEASEHIVLFTMHHIVSDGWSIGVLVNEFAAIYSAFVQNQPVPLPELPIQYADFAHWQRQWLSGDVLQRQLDYWTAQLSDSATLLTLPTDRPRPAVETHNGAALSFKISAQTAAGLNTLNKQTHTTLFMALAAAFDILLARYSGQDDICIGVPIANRNRAEIEPLIGFFVNTLVLRTHIDSTASFADLLQQVRATTLDAYAHQDLPFEQLVDTLHLERSTSHAPLFQVMLALHNAPMSALDASGLTMQPVSAENVTAKFDLTLNITESDGRLFADFEYNTDLFDHTTIERMSGHFTRLLDAIVANPTARIRDLQMLSADELHQLLVEWNSTPLSSPQFPRSSAENGGTEGGGNCIHELFESQVERTPEAQAVVFENQSLMYNELNQRANQLAHYLRSQGVGPDVLVGICVERSLEMIVGILGILKAGLRARRFAPVHSAHADEPDGQFARTQRSSDFHG